MRFVSELRALSKRGRSQGAEIHDFESVVSSADTRRSREVSPFERFREGLFCFLRRGTWSSARRSRARVPIREGAKLRQVGRGDRICSRDRFELRKNLVGLRACCSAERVPGLCDS